MSDVLSSLRVKSCFEGVLFWMLIILWLVVRVCRKNLASVEVGRIGRSRLEFQRRPEKGRVCGGAGKSPPTIVIARGPA